MDRRFIGSTGALVLGLLISTIAVGRGQEAVPQVLSGVGTIVGALAFRSLKRRRLGLCDNSIGRRLGEGAALVAILALVLLQGHDLARTYREPVPNLGIPPWEQLLAYVNPSGDVSAVEPPLAV